MSFGCNAFGAPITAFAGPPRGAASEWLTLSAKPRRAMPSVRVKWTDALLALFPEPIVHDHVSVYRME
jgi:hypothetical protein